MQDELTISFTGSAELSEIVGEYLAGEDYEEIASKGMTGGDGFCWIVSAALGSPVLIKLLDFLSSPRTQKAIGRVTAKTRNGQVIIERATAAQVAEVIRSLNRK